MVDPARYTTLFLDGCRDQIERLEWSLASIARGETENTIPAQRRAWHSLKGMSATMGHETVASVCHAAEDLVRGECREIPPRRLEVLERALDDIRRFVDALAREQPMPDLDGLLAALQAEARGTTPGKPIG